jgi:hypothetical protein
MASGFDYNGHILAFKRSNNSHILKVWRYTQDVRYEQSRYPSGLHFREPGVLPDNDQLATADNAFADLFMMGRDGGYLTDVAAYCGQFYPWLLLHLPEEPVTFKLRAPRVIIALSRRAVLYNACEGVLIQTFDVGANVWGVDLSGPYALISTETQLVIYACDTGLPLLHIPTKKMPCARALIAEVDMTWSGIWRAGSMLAPPRLRTRIEPKRRFEDRDYVKTCKLAVERSS